MTDQEAILFRWWESQKESGGVYFEYLGLSRDITFEEYRAHYDKDGGVDVERAAGDLDNYPPIAARIRELSVPPGVTIH